MGGGGGGGAGWVEVRYLPLADLLTLLSGLGKELVEGGSCQGDGLPTQKHTHTPLCLGVFIPL